MTDGLSPEMCASICMNASYSELEEALRRFHIVMDVVARCNLGASKSAAVAEASVRSGVHIRTVWHWLHRVDHVRCEPVVWIRLLLPRPYGRKPRPEHLHLHRNDEILSLEEVL